MQIYEELKARGLIAQVTDEEEIRDWSTTARPFSILALTPRGSLLWALHGGPCA